jgi:hypothetical protein
VKLVSWFGEKREDALWKQAKDILTNSKAEPEFVLKFYNMLTDPRHDKLWRVFYRINFRNKL